MYDTNKNNNFILMNGKVIADMEKEKIKQKVSGFARPPKLAVVIVGDNPASQSYVKSKEKDCIECGIDCFVYRYDDTISQEELCKVVGELNTQSEIDAILVQLPLPKHIDKNVVIEQIHQMKDVDCFRADNFGKLALGQPLYMPCTPSGIMDLLEAYGVKAEGKHCVVIGRSDIVGKPMALMLTQNGGTVTVCHSKTDDVAKYTMDADLIICAVGKQNFLTADMVKEGAVVVDVGINRNAEGKICGDVDFEAVSKKCSAITPVPGGVGLMTRTALLKNVIKAYILNTEGVCI